MEYVIHILNYTKQKESFYLARRYWYVILTYILMQLSAFPVALLAKHHYIPVQGVIYWSIFSFILGLLIILWIMKPDMQMRDTRNAAPMSSMILWSILGVFMAFFAQGIAVAIEMNILGISPGSENTQGIMDIARAAPLFIIIPAVIAPILEEIIFRKIIFGSLYKRMNFFFAGLVSALIFGFIHEGMEHILIYASMGFVFAFLYVKTKRILVPIIVHAAMNTLVVVGQFSMDPEEMQRQLEQMQRQVEQLQMILIGG